MELPVLLTTFGALLLVSLGLEAVGRMTRLPRITLLVLLGLVAGPSGFDLLPIDTAHWQEIVANLALTMIAFLLGGELSRQGLRASGRAILAVSATVTLVSLAVIAGGFWIGGLPLSLALVLGGVGLATDPAATRDVIRESGATGPTTRVLLGVVAIDDVWGVIVFSIVLGLAATGAEGVIGGLGTGLLEVAKSIGLGVVIGVPASVLTGRIQPGEPTLAEALGLVLLIAGLSLWFELSLLLVGMTVGAIVVNFASHHDRPFHEIEHASWPFLVVFFVLAGASVNLLEISGAWVLVAGFVALRMVGRGLGGWVGGLFGGIGAQKSRWIGAALTPQAGVALGMALVAAQELPDHANLILQVTVTTTIIFELLGPLLTRLVLTKVGEVPPKR